jgi:hypothetical protein
MGNKICTVATSEDGDRIYCLYKQGGDTMAKGFYDFNKHTFIITEFYTRKLPPDQTVEEVIKEMKYTLDVDFDWELKDEDKLIENINEGLMKKKKKKRVRHKKDGETGTHADDIHTKREGTGV